MFDGQKLQKKSFMLKKDLGSTSQTKQMKKLEAAQLGKAS